MAPSSDTEFLEDLELKEYEAMALEKLLTLGRTTAPNLADATEIPKARIYGVLDSLSNFGYVKTIPGRPKQYQPKPPAEILDRAVENHRQEYVEYRQEIADIREGFLEKYEPLYEQANENVTPTEELFYIVDVGDPSETETRQLYQDADETIRVITKSFEYFDRIEPALIDALQRDVAVRMLFLHPRHLEPENRRIQSEILERIRTEYPEVESRFSDEQLPWRGTITDPSREYETGKAILLVEEKDVPLHMRQAAITENGSFVAGMDRYFALTWKYASSSTEEQEGSD